MVLLLLSKTSGIVVQESFGERIVLDLELRDFLVLVSSHGDELGGWERHVVNQLPVTVVIALSIDFDYHDPRLVLVQTVQDDLIVVVHFVRKLHLGEVD